MVFRKKDLVGLDIGSSSIKIAQLHSSKDSYSLTLFDTLPLEPGVINDGLITDRDRLVATIKALLKQVGIKKADVAIGVSGHSSVIIKKITIPLMTEEELANSIKYEAEQYIPFDINDVTLDFQILGPKPDEESQMDIILVAVKKNVINDYVEAIIEGGLNPVVLDVDSFALSNMYEVNYGAVDGKNVALVNVGASKTNINILHHGMPVFTRDSAIGSNFHTEELERSFEITKEDAERLKRGQPLEKVSLEEARMIINAASDEIFAEIYRSFEYFRSSVSEEEISHVVLSGGAALIPGFADAMNDRLGTKVEIVDPFRNIAIPSKLNTPVIKEAGPVASVAVGLALRQAGDRE